MVSHSLIYIDSILIIIPEAVESIPEIDRSRTLKTKITITFDEEGCPELPDVTINDGYKTKIVQSMLREYCTEHIREILFTSFGKKLMCKSGFKTGKRLQSIPWGAFVKDPSSWMNNECFPPSFQWKDPSKIQIGEVFCLLDHWWDCKSRDLDTIIWVPTCPLFHIQDSSKRIRSTHQARVRQREALQNSNEEFFDLPSSSTGLSDNDDYESEVNNSSSHDEGQEESDGAVPSVHIPGLHGSKSGKHYIHVIRFRSSHMMCFTVSEQSEEWPGLQYSVPGIYKYLTLYITYITDTFYFR